jgi:ArsR family transcriptional regulator, arsenate/arsenite/antimonite-responsive transcriptional repressor
VTQAPRVRRHKTPEDADCTSDPLCCVPLGEGAISEGEAVAVATVLKAIADPVRLRLLSLVQHAPGGEVCVSDLVAAFDLSQPTVSHHLRLLADSGILRRERRGSWVWYSVNQERLDEIRGLLA